MWARQRSCRNSSLLSSCTSFSRLLPKRSPHQELQLLFQGRCGRLLVVQRQQPLCLLSRPLCCFYSSSSLQQQQQQGQGHGGAGGNNNAFFTATQKGVMDRCKQLHATTLLPLNEVWRGPLSADSDLGGTISAPPFCLLVGNHSSGKSTFINYLAGRSIQTTGVAPTDDAFTVIAPGAVDGDRDGPALVLGSSSSSSRHRHGTTGDDHADDDDHLGFLNGLRQFGPTLVQHTQLKVRANMKIPFLLVDSPGMIDAPHQFYNRSTSSQGRQQRRGYNDVDENFNDDDDDDDDIWMMDRGYDFTNVVRWFASRADVVCLFFDPDKPGTTGETLSVLLHALSGMDHKLLIVLNKADQFKKIHDFARAYGSLCWNLSKVIPRKDLPRIYTMCLPVGQNKDNSSGDINKSSADNTSTLFSRTMSNDGADNTKSGSSSSSGVSSALHDLYTARDEVVAEVCKAPARRVDNVITALHDAVLQLQMHAIVIQDLHTRWSKQYWQAKFQQFAIAITGISVAYISSTAAATTAVATAAATSGGQVTGGIVGFTILATGGMNWYHAVQMREWQRQVTRPEELAAALERTLQNNHNQSNRSSSSSVGGGTRRGRGGRRRPLQRDESLWAMWRGNVKDPLLRAVQQEGFFSMSSKRVSASELNQLKTILNQDIPAMRKQVSITSSSSPTRTSVADDL